VINPGLFSSLTDEWETPQELFDKLDAEFNFNLDPCCTKENAKCKRFFTKEDDGLSQEWSGSVYVNPPYGREIIKWCKKSYESSLFGALVVMLVPARTDTKWWHEYAMKAQEIRFIRGRIKFGGCKNSAPFPSAILIFDIFRKQQIITTAEK
jgi:phage N-6-adenine-methyltransferase